MIAVKRRTKVVQQTFGPDVTVQMLEKYPLRKQQEITVNVCVKVKRVIPYQAIFCQAVVGGDDDSKIVLKVNEESLVSKVLKAKKGSFLMIRNVCFVLNPKPLQGGPHSHHKHGSAPETSQDGDKSLFAHPSIGTTITPISMEDAVKLHGFSPKSTPLLSVTESLLDESSSSSPSGLPP